MIIVDRALISLFFFFFLTTLQENWLKMMWNSPHKGMPGTIATIMPLFLSFFVFFFSNYLLSFYRKTAHNQARDDWEPSPQRYARHDHSNRALYLFFFEYLLLINRKTAHVWAHDDVELSPQRYARHDCSNRALYLFFILNTYCLLTGKLPTFGLTMTWNCPHKGTLGTIITIVPFFLFFFEYLLFLQEDCPRSGSQ